MMPVLLFGVYQADNDEPSPPRQRWPAAGHLPVLAIEALDALQLQPGMTIIDGTFGGGGHSRLIADRIQPDGTLIAIDRDPRARAQFERLREAGLTIRMEFFHGSYAELERQLAALGISKVDGVLLDLGFSSLQIDDPERGFSFQHDGPLDMRFDQSSGEPASALVNDLPEAELSRIIYRYGDERRANRIARAIAKARESSRIESTAQLASIVESAVGGRRGSRTHPATRTFQALRIAVNDELTELERGLEAALAALKPGGRLAVISFHSIEDRIVKQFIAAQAKGCICPPEQPVCTCGRTATLRPIGRGVTPSPSEIAANPRARSARLRIAERLP